MRTGPTIAVRNIGNRLLADFPQDELRRLMRSAVEVSLIYGDRLFARGAPARHVYFPRRGAIAIVHRLSDGATVQITAVGNDGVTGIAGVIGDSTYCLDGIVQSPGSAVQIDADALQAAMRRNRRLNDILLHDVAQIGIETAQNIACCAHHTIEQRLARWLVTAYDAAGQGSLAVSHAFLSMMLGVQRTGITAALGHLKRAGLVDTRYGSVTVRDRQRLEAVSCSCYRDLRRLRARSIARRHRD
jgi:CRP-like cAMP-binding protein